MSTTTTLSELKVRDTFIIPDDTDVLPHESAGTGIPYLYRVTKKMPDGRIEVWNTDLRRHYIFESFTLVEKL